MTAPERPTAPGAPGAPARPPAGAVSDAEPATQAAHRGLVLFAHGARDPAWRAPFDAVRDRVRDGVPGRPVRLAFLEFMTPNLEEAGAELAALGCAHVDIVPLFLGAGGHVRRDVPDIVECLRARWPGVQWTLHRAAGAAPGVISALADAALAAARSPR